MSELNKLYFGEIKSDRLMANINLREISTIAKQWDHPGKGLLKFFEAYIKYGNNILKVPKKQRELYCLSLFGFGLQQDTGEEWWITSIDRESADGLVMKLRQVQGGLKTVIREVEVVEHRDELEALFKVILRKLTEKSYNPDTVLVCLILSPAIYDLRLLSEKLKKVSSPTNHVFVAFGGIILGENIPNVEAVKTKFSLIQVLPYFSHVEFDIAEQFRSFEEKYHKGQESRLINNREIHYGTANPKFKKV